MSFFGHSFFKHTTKTNAENNNANSYQKSVEKTTSSQNTRHPSEFIPTNNETAGLTGSFQTRDKEEHFHQMKRSISQASVKRRLKAAGLDRENFGEVIAAQIGRKLLKECLVPDVFPVYGSSNDGVYVASRYLGSKKNPAITLDKFAKEFDVTLSGPHVRVISNKYPRRDKGEITLDYAPGLKRDLCTAIVFSAVIGDHDINPGNMMVFRDDEGKKRIARIDFGHAFNDLLKCSQVNGGEVRDTKYPILDFFNRSEVGGILGAQSKLWRDYPDFILCEEMVDALRTMSKNFDAKVQEGIEASKTHFIDLIEDMDNNNDTGGVDHVRKSLDAICPEVITENSGALQESMETLTESPRASTESIGTSTESIGASDENNDPLYLDLIFDKIEHFVKEQGKNLEHIANVMALQIAIDNALKGKGSFHKIKELYKQFDGILPKTDEKIHWIKSGVHYESKFCTIEEFMTQRAKELIIENPKEKHKIRNNTHYIFTMCQFNSTLKFKESLNIQKGASQLEEEKTLNINT
ncbi:hypothetical protein Lsan_3284 [Legionella santicrucis]|uniref:LepB N-terminal domain-containing protein n=1 Tax=Legionella santicrucis TaxID=45074 RepID=A0A0W0YGG3_9GAMM|nr:hypothetical protein [Legionella santicrucis]KTD55732.1 hypothetical protein Lsan_3284 [Legionella santicrucis]